ncbi:MAG: SH3 domain-containing protein, partial [Pseudomonadota bacterium]
RTEGPEVIYRFGINLGDVIIEDEDVYGHGVNVAARLEGLAEPGEIYISRPVRDQIRDRLDYFLEDKGQIEVKNIQRPVRVFRVVDDPDEAARLRRAARARISKVRRLALGAAVFASVIAYDMSPAVSPVDDPVAGVLPTVEARKGTVTLLRRSNVRRGPGTDYQIAHTLDPGYRLQVTGEVKETSGRWYQVAVPDQPDPLYLHAALGQVADAQLPDILPPLTQVEDEVVLAATAENEDLGLFAEDPTDLALVQAQDADAERGTTATEPEESLRSTEADLWVRFSLDLSGSVFTDCAHHDIPGVHRLPVDQGSGWSTISEADGSGVDLTARAYPSPEGVVVEVLPYSDVWPSEQAIRVGFPDRAAGRTERGFSERRAGFPHEQCGAFQVYVSVVDAP